jgi:hypothetical protein
VSTTTTPLREPMDLPQLDPMSCLSNVCAQIRWMFGLSTVQGLDAVREFDGKSGRVPGEAGSLGASWLALAQEGCEVVVTSDFDLDGLRAGRVDYIASQRLTHDWCADDVAYWTPERVDAFIDRAECETEMLEQLAALGSRWERRQPEIEDVDRLLVDGYVVPLMASNGSAGTTHAVLLYEHLNAVTDGRSWSAYRVYNPAFHVPAEYNPVGVYGTDVLAEWWLGQSLVGVRR